MKKEKIRICFGRIFLLTEGRRNLVLVRKSKEDEERRKIQRKKMVGRKKCLQWWGLQGGGEGMFEESASLAPSYMSRVCYKYDKQAKPLGIWEFYGNELECELECVVEIEVSFRSNSTTFMSRMS